MEPSGIARRLQPSILRNTNCHPYSLHCYQPGTAEGVLGYNESNASDPESWDYFVMSTLLPHRATAKQLDPSRTSVLIRLYSRAMSKKLDALKAAIRQALVDRDVFGFTRGLLLHIDLPPE